MVSNTGSKGVVVPFLIVGRSIMVFASAGPGADGFVQPYD
jgi:hypothetical protein